MYTILISTEKDEVFQNYSTIEHLGYIYGESNELIWPIFIFQITRTILEVDINIRYLHPIETYEYEKR